MFVTHTIWGNHQLNGWYQRQLTGRSSHQMVTQMTANERAGFSWSRTLRTKQWHSPPIPWSRGSLSRRAKIALKLHGWLYHCFEFNLQFPQTTIPMSVTVIGDNPVNNGMESLNWPRWFLMDRPLHVSLPPSRWGYSPIVSHRNHYNLGIECYMTLRASELLIVTSVMQHQDQ